jgi:molybdenum cofactor cytidylyltransferase
MIENKRNNIAGILLAAGGSARLGKPKQLVETNGTTLLRHAAEILQKSKCSVVVVVVGDDVERSRAELEDLGVDLCVNPAWQSGMSSSIKAGLRFVLDLDPTLEAVLITLCDLPHVDVGAIDRLIAAFSASDAPMAAAEYAGVVGVPAIFNRTKFDELMNLEGDKGARELLRAADANVITVQIDEAALDVDTADDVVKLQRK